MSMKSRRWSFAATLFALVVMALVPTLPAMAATAATPQAPAAQVKAQPPAPPSDGVESPAVTPKTGPQGDIALPDKGENRCIEITVWAKNPDTGECQEFANPCSVPSGWQIFFDPTTCQNA